MQISNVYLSEDTPRPPTSHWCFGLHPRKSWKMPWHAPVQQYNDLNAGLVTVRLLVGLAWARNLLVSKFTINFWVHEHAKLTFTYYLNMIVLAVCITVKIHSSIHFFYIPHQTAVYIIWNHKSLAMTGERLSVANLVI